MPHGKEGLAHVGAAALVLCHSWEARGGVIEKREKEGSGTGLGKESLGSAGLGLRLSSCLCPL